MDRQLDNMLNIIQKHKLHSIANEKVANMYFPILKEIEPEISMLTVNSIHYFYCGKEGKDKLLLKLIDRQNCLKRELNKINKAIVELEKGTNQSE